MPVKLPVLKNRYKAFVKTQILKTESDSAGSRFTAGGFHSGRDLRKLLLRTQGFSAHNKKNS